MADFQFEDENLKFSGAPSMLRQESETLLIRLLIKWGIVKTHEQGQKVLLGILFGIILITVIVYIIFVGNASHDPVPSSQIYQYQL